jgi:hypothetical protein
MVFVDVAVERLMEESVWNDTFAGAMSRLASVILEIEQVKSSSSLFPKSRP